MFHRTLLVAATLAGTLAATSAQAQDITGTWRIASSETPDGSSYGGRVTIRPTGDCYTVEWELDSGDRYTGIGVKAGNFALAVAYSTGERDNYGVVVYALNKTAGRFNGWWCQPGGQLGVENLSGTTLTGSHRLSGGSSSGTVQIEPYGNGSVNYRLHWTTSGSEYDGFGTSLGEESGMMAGVWGGVDGTGVVLYSLVYADSGQLPGWWADSNTGGQGLETLER